jgi:NOL1/NOP2/fmu family ribosome biogenesis protein
MQRQETAVPGTAVSGTVPKPARFKPPKQSQIRLWHEFVAAHLHLSFPDDRLLLKNGRLYLLPETALDASGLNIMRYGVLLGEIRRGYFKPAHALALALRAEDGAAVNLTADSATAYLSGHDLPSDRSNGWTLVTVDGHTIGWGKQVGSRLKNHYPHRHRRLSVSRLKSKLP